MAQQWQCPRIVPLSHLRYIFPSTHLSPPLTGVEAGGRRLHRLLQLFKIFHLLFHRLGIHPRFPARKIAEPGCPTPPPPPPSVAKLSLAPNVRNSITAVTRLRLVLILTSPLSPPLPTRIPTPRRHLIPITRNHHDSTDSLSILTRYLSVLLSAPAPRLVATEHAARRRKMLKFAHMLGGPIPAAMPSTSHSRSSRGEPSSSSSAPSRSTSTRRKLVRPPSIQPLPALTVDRIAPPRPLAAFNPNAPRVYSPTPTSRVYSPTPASRLGAHSPGLHAPGAAALASASRPNTAPSAYADPPRSASVSPESPRSSGARGARGRGWGERARSVTPSYSLRRRGTGFGGEG
ncbi:hypothetical protein C8R44DRAFT_893138 [Mycena epipterygia]|nr:hypothetical protein C8R44DRAFT_893138 [Mycena epipterygia]